jgi:hypothetical protein
VAVDHELQPLGADDEELFIARCTGWGLVQSTVTTMTKKKSDRRLVKSKAQLGKGGDKARAKALLALEEEERAERERARATAVRFNPRLCVGAACWEEKGE